MTIHPDLSHLDHGLTEAHINWLLAQCAGREGFFIETFTLPDGLPDLQCGLYGPLMGDAPVEERLVRYAYRGGRTWASRLVDRPMRPTRLLTVIAGPHVPYPTLLYTAFGGPLAPQEVGDANCKDIDASLDFWAQHALCG